MVQIKLFRDHTPDLEKFEKLVNNFLCEHKDKIVVRDIKYTAEYPTHTIQHGKTGRQWLFMRWWKIPLNR